mgnify:CR=1 FL=1
MSIRSHVFLFPKTGDDGTSGGGGGEGEEWIWQDNDTHVWQDGDIAIWQGDAPIAATAWTWPDGADLEWPDATTVDE